MGFARICLYHKDYPDGQVFTEESEYLEALANGAVEAPWLVEKEEKEEVDPEKAKAGPAKPRKKRGFDLSPLEE